MPHKEFALLLKLYSGEDLNKIDLRLFDFIIKDIRQKVKDVVQNEIDNYLSYIRLKINYQNKDEKVIRDFLKNTIINTILEENDLVFNYFFYGQKSFNDYLNVKIKDTINSPLLRSNAFIQAIKIGTELKQKTLSLQKVNRELLTTKSIAEKFLGKKVSPERLDLYSAIKTEYELLRNNNIQGQKTSLTAAVRNVLRRRNKSVTEIEVKQVYKAYWSLLNNSNK